MHTSFKSVVACVPRTCLAASAALHDLDGHAVVAHYGSVPGEIAACLTSVGLADRSDYGAFESRCDRETLDRALGACLGEPPLAPGSGRRLRSVWYLRLDARHTLLAGPYGALDSETPLRRGRGHNAIPRRDVRAALAIVGIVGPRASRLLAAAGLPAELPIGGIGAGAGDDAVVAILRESQRRYLAVVRADVADAFWARLLHAGEPLGAALVGYDALALLNASSVAAS